MNALRPDASAEPFVTRAEFVDGQFVYAVQVDTSAGSFELCPADACTIDLAPAVCEVPLQVEAAEAQEKLDAGAAQFRERPAITAEDPLVVALCGFLREHGIEVAGVEFIEKADGTRVVYDINTNTNYNGDVEALTENSARHALARFMGRELAAVQERLAVHA
ncbi:hypothetical protein [Brevibacterium litoralis]|uniref:hypothetical protein n=1 Tax=Brevibacterium litoralis TaxID=3138935 RepID=UPI0032EDD910